MIYKNKRGDLKKDMLIGILILLILLGIMLFSYLIATGKMNSMFEWIKNMIKFGG